MRVARVVALQDVEAEVAFEVVPDDVDVIGVGGGVVELDQEARAVDAVVVGLAGGGGAGPGEAHGVAVGLDGVAARSGDTGRQVGEVDLDQRVECARLRGAKACSQAACLLAASKHLADLDLKEEKFCRDGSLLLFEGTVRI